MTRPEPDKRVIRLPDGRRLVFYRFPEEPQGRTEPEEAPPAAGPAPLRPDEGP